MSTESPQEYKYIRQAQNKHLLPGYTCIVYILGVCAWELAMWRTHYYLHVDIQDHVNTRLMMCVFEYMYI